MIKKIFKGLNENYYIYFIIIFVFVPLNLLNQHFDGVLIDYAFTNKDIGPIVQWYIEGGRHFHLIPIYLINFLTNFTPIPAEIFLDNILVIFLILLCIEVKKFSKILFNLEDKWNNLSALFVSIFPIWHILVSFDIGQSIISIYFLFFGYRNFIEKKKFKVLIGIIFIILSFNIESNLSFIIGLSAIHVILQNKSKDLFFKLILLIAITIFYYILRSSFFPPSGLYEGYNTIHLGLLNNIAWIKLSKNVLNYLTFLIIYLWIPLLFFSHIFFKNREEFILKLKKFNIKYLHNYFYLIILAIFATFPYIISNKSSSIFFLSDYYQRHAVLLAPISGFLFSIMFKDMNNFLKFFPKTNFYPYIIIFILINLTFLNYGNYSKIESNLFKINLVNELKKIEAPHKGNIKFVGSDIPADLRFFEINHLLYRAYKDTGWYGITFGPWDISSVKTYGKKYEKIFIYKDYSPGCNTKIFLKNYLSKKDRIKKFYIFNSKNYYQIDKIEKKC
tara:strand:- start:10658 stop:12166 length:1509 start_codon:yes stop_codon:yes gene_type:complete